MAALQRKIRLLQDLRFFVETASAEELAGFGDELRAVMTGSGRSVGSIISMLLGASGPAAGAQIAAERGGAALSGLFPAQNSPGSAAQRGADALPRRDALPAEGAAASPAALSPAAVGNTARPESQNSASGLGAAPGPASAEAPASTEAGHSDDLRAEALAAIDGTMKSIPAGTFVMGSDAGSDAEKPPHKVTLSAYRVCDHLITNREYALFVRAQPQWSKDRADPELRDDSYLSDWTGDQFPEGKDEHPVAFVSYHAAEAFATWIGKRLPTEAEWECAARGGLVGKKYPNGDQMNDKLANLAKQYKGTTPVRNFEANGFGLYDMAGNLFEWTSDWYGPYSSGEALDPTGPKEGEYKVVRGGSWMSGAGALKVSARVDMESVTCGQIGIRLVDRAQP
jgi:formylglycine-generating enzyme required for sulfatase activity